MRYVLYVLGCTALAVLSAEASVSVSGLSITPWNLIYLLDFATLAYLIAVCALALFATGSLRSFGRGVVSMFGNNRKKAMTPAQARESLSALNMVCVASLLAGGLGLLTNLIRAAHALAAADMGIPVNIACLSLCYPLFWNLLMVPVRTSLKKRAQEGEKSAKCRSVSFARRRAG